MHMHIGLERKKYKRVLFYWLTAAESARTERIMLGTNYGNQSTCFFAEVVVYRIYNFLTKPLHHSKSHSSITSHCKNVSGAVGPIVRLKICTKWCVCVRRRPCLSRSPSLSLSSLSLSLSLSFFLSLSLSLSLSTPSLPLFLPIPSLPLFLSPFIFLSLPSSLPHARAHAHKVSVVQA